jgi:group I intron endonuclease
MVAPYPQVTKHSECTRENGFECMYNFLLINTQTRMSSIIDQWVGFIYLITNLVNGKMYVGLTTRTILQRFHKHLLNARSGEESSLYSAFRKYGESNFKIEPLCRVKSDSEDGLKKQLANMEEYYADQLGTYVWDVYPGYNMAVCGAQPTLGVKHTPEELRKMSLARQGYTATEETKTKTSASLKLYHINASSEEREKIRERAVRRGKAQEGVPKPQEVKDKISKTLTGRVDSPNVIANKMASHIEIGKSGYKYIQPHKWSGWIVLLNNKTNGTFSKTFPTLEEAISARDEFLSKHTSITIPTTQNE